MKRFFRWLGRIVGTAITLVLAIVLLPYASKLASAYLPDLSGAAVNATVLLSHQMESSARLETATIEDESVLNATTNALFLGQVQSVSIQYVYRASIGIDLQKVQIGLRGQTITLSLPPLEILSDSLTPIQVEKDDFWYPLTEERRQQLLDDELTQCRQRCLEEYLTSDEAWANTVSAVERTVSGWLSTTAPGVTVDIRPGE